jgi:hypothetical protein
MHHERSKAPLTAAKHRWFRFSLRTLFVVVTVVCCWLGWEFRFVQERKAALKAVHDHYDKMPGINGFGAISCPFLVAQTMNGHPPTIPAIRTCMGDRPVGFITVPLQSEANSLKRLFPESEIMYIDPTFNVWFETVGARFGIHSPVTSTH